VVWEDGGRKASSYPIEGRPAVSLSNRELRKRRRSMGQGGNRPRSWKSSGRCPPCILRKDQGPRAKAKGWSGDVPIGPAAARKCQDCLYFRHLELIGHRSIGLRKLPKAKVDNPISCASKWPVLPRPQLAGFDSRFHLNENTICAKSANHENLKADEPQGGSRCHKHQSAQCRH